MDARTYKRKEWITTSRSARSSHHENPRCLIEIEGFLSAATTTLIASQIPFDLT